MINNRTRHKQLKISSRDAAKGMSSQFTIDLGTAAYPNAEAISLLSADIPNFVNNVNSINNTFVIYKKDYIEFVSGTNDLIIVEDTETGIQYNYNIGNLSIIPATFDASLTAITAGINGLLPSSVIDIRGQVGVPVNDPRYLEGQTVSGNLIKIIYAGNTAAFSMGISENIVLPLGAYQAFQNPAAGILFTIPEAQYNITQLKTVIAAEINAIITPDTVTVQSVKDVVILEPYNEHIIFTFGGVTPSNVWFIGSLDEGSTFSPAIGFTGEIAQNQHTAASLPQLFGIRTVYLHVKQFNRSGTMISQQAKLTSIHAVIPVYANYGEIIRYVAPQRHYHKISLPRSSNNIKNIQFTLRDSEGNLLTDLDEYNCDFFFDFDIIER